MSSNPEVDAAMFYAICAVIVFIGLAGSLVLNIWQHFTIRELRDKLSTRNALREVSR